MLKFVHKLLFPFIAIYIYCVHQSLIFGEFQLSDFGLAITDGSQNKNNIKLSGTLGYVAPEYILDGMPT